MKIFYRLGEKFGERESFCNDSTDVLTMSFTPRKSGILSIGEKRYTVAGGDAKISIYDLPKGTHFPVFQSSDGIQKLEPFEKRGEEINIPLTDEETVRRLLERVFDLECACKDYEKRISDLENAVRGHRIFG